MKFDFGKKYFNYLNLFLIFLYVITTITSLLTLVQAFSLNTVLEFTLNFVLGIYLIHTMLRGTRLWKELRLFNSPFNEFTNEGSYYIVILLSVFLLVVNLISTVVLSGIVLSILDALYLILFGRYIFLYRKYLDTHKIDFINEGNFDEMRKVVDEIVEVVKEKTTEILDKTDIDEKIIEAKDKVVEKTKDILDETELDDKLIEIKDKAVKKTKKVLKKEEKPKKKTTKTSKTQKKGAKK